MLYLTTIPVGVAPMGVHAVFKDIPVIGAPMGVHAVFKDIPVIGAQWAYMLYL